MICGYAVARGSTHNNGARPNFGPVKTVMVCVLLVFSSGCGLVFQSRESRVTITAYPPDAEVRFAGRKLTSPETVVLPRRRNGVYVVRVSKDGYRDACRVIRFRKNGWLIALDSIPLALGLAVDAAAKTWPGNFPKSVEIALVEGSDDDIEPLPPDHVLLQQMRTTPIDPCLLPRRKKPPKPKSEKTAARYRLRLESVAVDGRKLRVEQDLDAEKTARSVTSVIVDDPVRLEVTPRLDMIDLRVVNEASTSIKIDWEDAVFVDFDQTSNPIGRLGRNHGSMDDSAQSVVAPETAINKSVFSLNRIFELKTTAEVTDEVCTRSCLDTVFQCMAGYNCSGYRSRQPYTGDGWILVAIAEQYGAGLCERRCIDIGQACVRNCNRTVEHVAGVTHLDMVPGLPRKCSRDETDFEREATTTDLGSYAVLLPIDVAGRRREYMMRFEPELYEFELSEACWTGQ